MTTTTPHGQVPEALTHERDRAIMEGERNASLDAYSRVVLLTSAESRLYEAAFTNGWDRCAAHVQNPTKIEHVAGDVSKNGTESNMSTQQPAPASQQEAPAEELEEVLRERDDAEDFINELLDEVLGADRPEWSSAYNRYDAMNDVRERITASRTPAESVGRDAERLDWLEQHSQVNIERVRYLGSDESVYEVTPYNSADYDGKTLRAAIDAAMAANGGNK